MILPLATLSKMPAEGMGWDVYIAIQVMIQACDKSSIPGSLGDLEVQPPGFVLIQAYVKSITRSNQFSDLQFSNT